MVWLPWILFSQKYWVSIIIPIDELHHFSEGFKPTTNQTILTNSPTPWLEKPLRSFGDPFPVAFPTAAGMGVLAGWRRRRLRPMKDLGIFCGEDLGIPHGFRSEWMDILTNIWRFYDGKIYDLYISIDDGFEEGHDLLMMDNCMCRVDFNWNMIYTTVEFSGTMI